MKKPIVLAIACIVALAAVGGGFLYWQNQSRIAKIATSSVPDLPSLDGQNERFAKRVREADDQARNGPDSLAALAELSRLYHANGYLREAWSAYAGLMQAEPGNPLWPYRLASILSGYGQLEDALPLYRNALELDQSYLPAHIRIGDTLLKLNRIDEAKAAYDRALGRDPKNAYALVGIARVAIAREDWQTAREKLEAAIGSTQFQIGADLLGDVYEKLGLPSKERIVLKNIRWGSYADIPDPRLLSLMDDSYDAYQVSIAGGWAGHQGDKENALKYIRKAIALEPENPHFHYQYAGLLGELGKHSEALAEYQRCVELKPDFADAWLRLIDNARQTGNATAARRLLDTALRACPDSPSLHNQKGDELLAAKQYEQAAYYYKRSIELRPNEASGYICLARLFLETNRIAEGIDQMRKALEQEPNNELAASTLAFQAIMSGNRAEADAWFARFADMPRFTDESMTQLAQQYRARFGQAPPR